MTETENGDTTPLKPKKREGSRLDRGFPMGKVLLIILGFVFFFQIISGWKIINLEIEKGKLENEKTIFETNKGNYYFIMQKLPELRRQNGELEILRQELQGKINDLEKKNTMVREELKENEQRSNDRKLDNEMQEKRLARTRILVQEAEAAKIQSFNEQSALNRVSEKIKFDIKKYKDEKGNLEETIRERKKENTDLESDYFRLESRNAALSASIKAREDELLKLKNSNSELVDIVKNLKNTPHEFNQFQSEVKTILEQAVKDLNSTTSNIAGSAKAFEQTQRDTKSKLEVAVKGLENTIDTIRISSRELTHSQSEAVDNINKESSRLEKTTANYSTKIDLATGSLKKNVEQLFTIGSKLDNLSVRLNNSANKVDNELKIIDQQLNASETNQKQLEELLANVTRISGSLSSDSSVLNNALKKLKEDVGSAVQKLGDATSNIESNSKNFNEKVSTLDISSKKLNSLLDNIKFIYRELDSIKQRQTDLVDNFQDLVKRIKQSFDQIRNDSSSAIEGVKDLKDNIREVEKKVESLNTGTKKPNEKEEE